MSKAFLLFVNYYLLLLSDKTFMRIQKNGLIPLQESAQMV